MEKKRLSKIALLFAAVTGWTTTTQARYTYNPADLSDPSFQCAAEDDAETCTQARTFDAYWNQYGDQFKKWIFSLAYDPDQFFDPYFEYDDGVEQVDRPPMALLDIRHDIALRQFGGWTMAVDMVCSAPMTDANWRAKCRPVARLTRPRYFDPNDTAQQAELTKINALLDSRGHPTSKAELAEDLDLSMEWLEADLRTCKGAIAHLARFPGQTERLWEPEYLDWISGRKLPVDPTDGDEIIITTDGDGYLVRAAGRTNPAGMGMGRATTFSTTMEWNGGTTYDWTAQFYTLVAPCMKPANVPAPWQDYRIGLGAD